MKSTGVFSTKSDSQYTAPRTEITSHGSGKCLRDIRKALLSYFSLAVKTLNALTLLQKSNFEPALYIEK